jgi:hypothetical protein
MVGKVQFGKVITDLCMCSFLGGDKLLENFLFDNALTMNRRISFSRAIDKKWVVENKN